MPEFVKVNATDTLQRGALFRLTFARSWLLGWAASSASTIWTAIEGLAFPVFRVSPKPADGPVAVIDVKVRADAASQSVGAMANDLDVFANWTLTRVERLDSEALSAATAASDRTEQTRAAVAALPKVPNPLNALGDVLGAFKWIVIGAGIGFGIYLYVKHGPKPRKGRR